MELIPLMRVGSVLSMNVKIRWALPHEGLVIQEILQSQNVDLAGQVNWLLPLGPYWLLYCDPDPLACLLVNPGTPVGRLEWLTIHTKATKRQRALAVKELCYAGGRILKQGGSQLVAWYLNDENEKWKKIVEKHGGFPIERGTLYMGRV